MQHKQYDNKSPLMGKTKTRYNQGDGSYSATPLHHIASHRLCSSLLHLERLAQS